MVKNSFKIVMLVTISMVLSGCLAPAMVLVSSGHGALNYLQLEDIKLRLDNLQQNLTLILI